MSNHKLLSWYHAVQHSRKYLYWTGTISWRREATFLLSVWMVLIAGYLTAFYFASHAVQDLVDTCTASLVIEFENAEMSSLPQALPRSLCECMAHSLLDKNGMVRLALLNQHMLDPMALEPVTEKDKEACLNALWLPTFELAHG
ncbi:hypothetical protein [Pseudomonas gregormendelii]